MSTDLARAWELIEEGDVPAIMRHLRFSADRLELADLARVVERVAGMVGFDDLVRASAELAADPAGPQALYDFGYACIDRGASYLAVPALSAALRLVPDSAAVLVELVAALEDVHRHGEAVTVLEEREARLRPWPDRYLLVYNAIMAGDLARATRHAGRLPDPDDERWLPARDRVRRMLDRAALARTAGPLDLKDLRGWHFTLTGGVLATLSPYGFDAGMTGRYAFLQDAYVSCLRGLHRLRLILDAAGRRPRSVSPLPDRSSRILGLAAAGVLGLPAEPFDAARPDTVVVAYDLTDTAEDAVSRLRERVPGQVLYEHATCWTEPPAVSADVSTLLRQTIIAPWGETMRQTADGSLERSPADDRPVERVAADIMAAGVDDDPGDGATPPDPDENLAAFVRAVADGWLTGPRDAVRSHGPVPGSRFL